MYKNNKSANKQQTTAALAITLEEGDEVFGGMNCSPKTKTALRQLMCIQVNNNDESLPMFKGDRINDSYLYMGLQKYQLRSTGEDFYDHVMVNGTFPNELEFYAIPSNMVEILFPHVAKINRKAKNTEQVKPKVKKSGQSLRHLAPVNPASEKKPMSIENVFTLFTLATKAYESNKNKIVISDEEKEKYKSEKKKKEEELQAIKDELEEAIKVLRKEYESRMSVVVNELDKIDSSLAGETKETTLYKETKAEFTKMHKIPQEYEMELLNKLNGK